MNLNIVATLGPASKDENIIKKIIDGVSELRLNASHLTKLELKENLVKLESIFSKIGKKIPVTIDLKGAKIRIGSYPSTDMIPKMVKILNIDSSNDSSVIPLNNKLFFENIKEGMRLYLNDAKVILDVLSVKPGEISCKTIKNGHLSTNKGINIKDHPIPYNKVTDFDREMIEIGEKFDFTQFAFSFVHTGEEVELLREFTSKRLIAKVEREESLQHLENIDKRFDDIWFCRGDLGAQVGLVNLGRVQYEFIEKMNQLNSDIYLAGEVLYHMTNSQTPTRSEITQLYMLEKKGFKGFVLSDETAVGENPEKVIEFLTMLKR